MKVLIVEDEKPAAEKLISALSIANSQIEVKGVVGSIRKTIEWLNLNEPPDLILMDIELEDGVSFSIFERTEVSSPVIFCTAFDEYWQQAFEQNSIDYLLKPIKQEKLNAALTKYEKLKHHFTRDLKERLLSAGNSGQACKKRFLVKRGADYVSIKTDEIAYFYATHKLVCLVDNNSQKYILDQSLSEIETQLDKQQFYRVNRKYLINQNAIKKIKMLPKSKLQLQVQPLAVEEIVVSQENSAAFKEWMGQ